MKGFIINRAGRWTLYILGIIVGLIVIAVMAFYLAGDYMIKVAIERGGNYALKVPVEVNSVHLSVLGGSIKIDGMRIANPQGYEYPQLLNLGHAQAAVQIGSLTGDVVNIDSIILDGIDVTIEQKGLSTNLQEIIKALPQSKEQSQQAPEKKFKIKTLEISNVNVTLKLLPIPGRSSSVKVKIAPIRLENLGSDSPISMVTLVSKVLVAITEGVAKQTFDLMPKGLTDSLQNTLGQSQQVFQQGSQEILNLGKGVTGGFGNIFGGKKNQK